MKVECVQKKLELILTKAEKLAGKHITLPILKCFLIEASEGKLTVRTTNLDIGVEMSIPAKVIKEGIVAVPADVLKTFVSSLTGENKVIFEKTESVLIVTTDHTVTRIKVENHEEFPSIPKITNGVTLTIENSKFIDGVRSVMYCASPASMKPELASIYIYKENTSLVFVATDSFRLAEKKIILQKSPDIDSILVPYKNIVDIVKILDGVEGTSELVLSENQIALSHEDMYVTSRIIDGVFPDYRQIIPKEFETGVVVLKQDLQKTLKTSTIFSDKFNQIAISVDPEDKQCSVETQNTDVGDSVNYLEATISGKPITMNFNHRYVSDSLQSLTSDSVSLEFSAGKPLVIRAVGDGSFLYLVMPIHT